MKSAVAFSIDHALGRAVDHRVCVHHRRRLRRLGWEHALDASGSGWAGGQPPARGGHELKVLIDGANALTAMAEELAAAESHVHMACWYFSPELDLTRDGGPTVLRNLLAEL
jgi:phosphatidylserine/phosphatidylglycerophosphate/cardiolipin synthase-like enzyme